MDSVAALRTVLQAAPDVCLAVLFGSGARGTSGAMSDLDVGIRLTPGPSKHRLVDLEVELGRATQRTIDLVDLAVAPPLLRFEIGRDGILLHEGVSYAWADFKAGAMIDWWDWQDTARLIHEAARQRLRLQVEHGTP